MSQEKTREEALAEVRRLAAKVLNNDTAIEIKVIPKEDFPKNKKPTAQNITNLVDATEYVSPKKELGGLNHRKSLTIAEEKVFLILTLLYRQIMAEASNFQIGYAKWYKILPSKLAEYGLSNDDWNRISEIGDNDPKLQKKIAAVEKSL